MADGTTTEIDPMADLAEDRHLPDPEPGDDGYEPSEDAKAVGDAWEGGLDAADPTPEEMAAIDAEVDALLGLNLIATTDPDPDQLDPAELEAWRQTSTLVLTDVKDTTRAVLRDFGIHTVGDLIDLYEGWEPATDDPLVAGLNLTGWYAGELQTAVARTLVGTGLAAERVLPWVFMKAEAEPPGSDADEHTAGQVVVIPPAPEPGGEPAAEPPGTAEHGAPEEGTLAADAQAAQVLGGWRDRDLPQFANSVMDRAIAAAGYKTHGELDAAIRAFPGVFFLDLSEFQLTSLFDYMARTAAGDVAFAPYDKPWQGPEARAEAEEKRKRELEAFDAETAHMMNELFAKLVAAKQKHVRLKTEAAFAKKDVDEALKELEELHQNRAEERDYPRLIPSAATPIVTSEGAEVKSKQAQRDRPKKGKEPPATPAAEPAVPGQLSDALSKQLMLEFPLDTHRWERFGATPKMMESLRGGVTKKHGTHPNAAFGDLARFVQPQGDGGFTRYLTDIKGFGEKMLKDWEEVQNKFYQAWGEWLAVAFARERGYIEAEHHTPEVKADGQQVDDTGTPAGAARGPGAAGADGDHAQAGGRPAATPAPDARTHAKPGKPKPKKQPKKQPAKRAGTGSGKPVKPKFALPKAKPAKPVKPAPRRFPHAANPGKKGKK